MSKDAILQPTDSPEVMSQNSMGTPAHEAAFKDRPSRGRYFFNVAWSTLNYLLIVSLVLLVCSAVWEYSTRRYLKGFSDAIIPVSSSPEEKIEAILNWMAHGPARYITTPTGLSPARDPSDTLNYRSLLAVCGTATNAFINLADSGGLTARRLLLLNSHRTAKHVVAEVLIGGRWIIVDPAFRTILRGPDGQTLTREELANPAIFAAATRNIPGYDSTYTYDRTAHIRLARLHAMGMLLRDLLHRIFPGWEGLPILSLILERESMTTLLSSTLLAFVLFLFRTVLRRYGENRLGLRPVRLRTRMFRACHAFFSVVN